MKFDFTGCSLHSGLPVVELCKCTGIYIYNHRSGHIIDQFTERMNKLALMKSAKQKSSRLAPLASTIGKFTSAFRKFETSDVRKMSQTSDDRDIHIYRPAEKALSPESNENIMQIECNEKSDDKSSTKMPKSSTRSVRLPVESARMVKPIREPRGAPDLIPIEVASNTTHEKVSK